MRQHVLRQNPPLVSVIGLSRTLARRNLRQKSGPRIKSGGRESSWDRHYRSRSAGGQISQASRTGWKAGCSRRASPQTSAERADARGSTPSSLPEEPGPAQEPEPGPEPSSEPESEQPASSPPHSRRPGHSSSVCSSHRRPRNRTAAGPSLHGGGRGDRSQPTRRSRRPRLRGCSSKDSGAATRRFARPPHGGRVHQRR